MILPHKKQGDIWEASTVILGSPKNHGKSWVCRTWKALPLVWGLPTPRGKQDDMGLLVDSNSAVYLLHWYTHLTFSPFFRINLYELMKNNSFQGFSLSIVRRFTLSVLKCLQMLYVEKIIHCDLKPVSTSSVLPRERFRPSEMVRPILFSSGNWEAIMAKVPGRQPRSYVFMLCNPRTVQWRLRGRYQDNALSSSGQWFIIKTDGSRKVWGLSYRELRGVQRHMLCG